MRRVACLSLTVLGLVAVSHPADARQSTYVEKAAWKVSRGDLLPSLWGRAVVWMKAVRDFRTDAQVGPKGDRVLFPPLLGGPRVRVSVHLTGKEYDRGELQAYEFEVVARHLGSTYRRRYFYTPSAQGGPSARPAKTGLGWTDPAAPWTTP